MKTEIVIHGFETSNNTKVRIALGYKKIPYSFQTIDPKDRSEIERLSGQHLTPVMVHGDRVLFDSAAILRYLDANFLDTPRLFGHSHREQWEIEDHEHFARATLAGPVMEVIHHRVHQGPVDEATQERCAAEFSQALLRLVNNLDEREWLVGDGMTAADITTAPVVYRAIEGKLFPLPAAVEQVRGWVDRVMSHDRYLAR